MHVFSLSSIPPRFPLLEPTLETIVAQSVRAEEIILYLPRRYRRFPDYDGTLPRVPKGVKIRQVDEDIGPATKMLYAAMDYRDQGLDLIFGDDDRYYHQHLSRWLLDGQKDCPGAAIGGHGYDLDKLGLVPGTRRPRAEPVQIKTPDLRYRYDRAMQRLFGSKHLPKGMKPSRRAYATSGYVDIVQGYAGVLVKPEYFRPEDLIIPDEAWLMDDIWISGLLEKRGIPIWIPSTGRIYPHKEHLPEALLHAVIEGADRSDVNQICVNYMIQHFGIWGGKSRM